MLINWQHDYKTCDLKTNLVSEDDNLIGSLTLIKWKMCVYIHIYIKEEI